MKSNKKEQELDKIELKSMGLKENERMERFKIEERKELEIELRQLESELELNQNWKSHYLENKN